jgi:DNA helicase II / ATP-dependent DNA helicase PcrA
VIGRVSQERRPGQPLEAVAFNGEGFVGTALLTDQRAEAEFIAGEILKYHGKPVGPGRPVTGWKDFAILVRRKSHMGLIYSVLKEHEIPVEVVGLGGLLQVPEVMDTVSWLRLVAEPGPGSNRWLARILLGPRYRIHYRDLAVLARWAAGRTRALADTKKRDLPHAEGTKVPDETDFEPDDVAFSLVEALDHLELIPQLAPDALERLLRMRAELWALRRAAGAPLLDLVQKIVATTGIADALAASPRQDAAASMGNLRQFMSLVANFAPISGEPSLAEFLEYLDAAEDAEDTMELEVHQADDSVKLTTVHGAKGLEFEVVFVPGVAASENAKGEKVYSIFPDERASNPMISYGQLPYGVREDAQHLPNPLTVDAKGDPVLKKRAQFARELKERAVEDERRLYYVALTRARQRLYVTASWWYERQKRPHGPSIFFDEVTALDAVENLVVADQPAESPLLAELEARAVWPPVVRNLFAPTAAFPQGPVDALEDLLQGRRTADELLAALDEDDRGEAEKILAGYRSTITALSHEGTSLSDDGLKSNEQEVPSRPTRSLSASDAVALAAGRITDRQLFRPLPQRPSGAARIGVEIHRWIEERARGLTGLADEEGLDASGSHVDTGRLAGLKATWEEQFASRTLARLPGGEPMAELRFVLKVGERLVRGRMDAVYENPEGGLEVVDFKTGDRIEQPDLDQLTVYAGALRKLNIKLGTSLKLTYAYLASGETLSREMDAAGIDTALSLLSDRLAGSG